MFCIDSEVSFVGSEEGIFQFLMSLVYNGAVVDAGSEVNVGEYLTVQIDFLSPMDGLNMYVQACTANAAEEGGPSYPLIADRSAV